MVGINGIGGIPEPKPDRPANVRDNKQSSATGDSTSSSDDVVISSEAQAAAVVASTIQVTEGQGDIRADRVEEAKAAIERGDYKNPDNVEVVAERLNKLL